MWSEDRINEFKTARYQGMVRGTLALYSPSPCRPPPTANQQSIEMKISTFLKYTNYTSGETKFICAFAT